MTLASSFKSGRLIPAATVLAAVGFAAACSATSATVASVSAANQPFTCEISADTQGHMVNFEGRVQAASAVSGTYSLTIAGGGTNISQGGSFAARAGETVTLGQAMLSGSASRYDTTLTVEVAGHRTDCTLDL